MLPAGRVVRDQANVSGLPSTSEEADPLRVTVLPTFTVWSGPALATGGLFSVVIVIVSAAELTNPVVHDELNDIGAGPADGNGRRDGCGIRDGDVLPAGALTIDQLKVNAWPSTSVDSDPLS